VEDRDPHPAHHQRETEESHFIASFLRWLVKQTVWAAGLGLFEDLSHFWLLVVQQLGSGFLGGGCWRGRTRSQDVGGW